MSLTGSGNSTARKNKDAGNPMRLLKPDVLARLSTLELVAKAVVDGYFTGLHRSPYFGFSQEFAEYRAYNEGDDLRFVDWNVYARTGRTYIKRFHGDTNTALTMMLDVSASMGYKSGAVSKLEYGKYVAASLAYLAKRQHDAMALMLFDDVIRERMPPASHPDTLYRLLAQLERAEASHGTRIDDGLEQLAASVSRRGMVVVISDFYCDPEQLTASLHPLTQRGHEVLLIHVLDPAELDPATHQKQLRAASTLRDMESGEETKVSPAFLQQTYPQRVQAHIDQLQRAATRASVDYLYANTAQPLGDVLQQYLHLRQQRR